MPEWHLEAITPQDIDKILIIDRTAFKRPWHRKSFINELECDSAYSYAVRTQLADKRMEIIAYVIFRVALTEMNILRIAVTPDFKSKGVATWLLEQCFKIARQKKVNSAFIEVRPTNNAAIALYRKTGFQLVGTRPKYYPETGEDAMVMAKQLKESL